jgi:uncharacterized protein (TIGR02646 family)
MRFVKKNLSKVPPCLVNVNALNELEEIAQGSLNLIKPKVYKGHYKDENGKLKSEVRKYLNRVYYKKCGYCERFCKAEIEHYRPKKGVDESRDHEGYYWLCYEWSNLVPACRYCNTEGGKGNKFPILDENKRIFKPEFVATKLDKSKCNAYLTPLKDEKPYLLHPEIDDPKEFLGFNIKANKKDVIIVGKDAENRGKRTVQICNLNRDELLVERLESVFYKAKQSFNFVFDYMALGKIVKEDVTSALKLVFKQLSEELNNKKLSHTLLRWFILETEANFVNIFAPYIENDEKRALIIEAYKLYKAEAA